MSLKAWMLGNFLVTGIFCFFSMNNYYQLQLKRYWFWVFSEKRIANLIDACPGPSAFMHLHASIFFIVMFFQGRLIVKNIFSNVFFKKEDFYNRKSNSIFVPPNRRISEHLLWKYAESDASAMFLTINYVLGNDKRLECIWAELMRLLATTTTYIKNLIKKNLD